MSRVEKSIEVSVPVRAAYDQWTDFESFPEFMTDIEEVQRVDDTHLHWIAEIGGLRQEWDAEITELVEDQRVAWASRSGAHNSGVVTFEQLSPNETRVNLVLEYDPEGILENIGDWLGVMDTRVESDLEAFKIYVEPVGDEFDGINDEMPADEDAS